jgi:hypothetical protein
MDLRGIISVSGLSGLHKVIAQTKNGLLIESLVDNKRQPIYNSHKVSSLDDISIYGISEDIPLKEILKTIKEKLAGKPAEDYKENSEGAKKAFAEYIPQHDANRVYASDMKKVFFWYNLLLAKDLLNDTPETEKEGETTKTEVPAAKIASVKAKDTPKAAPKASSKGMAKTQTVRKTGG